MKLWHIFLTLCICIAICFVVKWAFLLAIFCGTVLIFKVISKWYRFKERLRGEPRGGIKDRSKPFL